MSAATGVKLSLCGSKISAKLLCEARLAPPAISTRPSASRVALGNWRSWRIVAATSRNWRCSGSHSSAVWRLMPPTTSTRPSASATAAWRLRACTSRPPSLTAPLRSSIRSATAPMSRPTWPPSTRMRPSGRRVAVWPLRPVRRLPMRAKRARAGSKRSIASERGALPARTADHDHAAVGRRHGRVVLDVEGLGQRRVAVAVLDAEIEFAARARLARRLDDQRVAAGCGPAAAARRPRRWRPRRRPARRGPGRR